MLSFMAQQPPVKDVNPTNPSANNGYLRRLLLLLPGVLALVALLVTAACAPPPAGAVVDAPRDAQNVLGKQELPQTVTALPLSSVATAEPLPSIVAPATAAAIVPSLTPLPTTVPSAGLLDEPLPSAVPLLPTVSPTVTPVPPLPTPQGVYSWTLKVPILMYHYISVPPPGADPYRTDLSVTPDEFRRQMAYLAENGYETVDLYDLSLAITAKKELPPKPVVITMDDGYRDNYEYAFPILKEFGQKATFFVVTQPIDENHPDYMTWSMVEEMAAAGMRIEPHSKTHPDLRGQHRDYVIYEILGAQESIAARVGYTPRYFCYPGGSYDETTLAVLQELNFWGAVTTTHGEWHGFDDRFEWRRMRMRNTTDLDEFQKLIDPAGTVAGKFPQG